MKFISFIAVLIMALFATVSCDDLCPNSTNTCPSLQCNITCQGYQCGCQCTCPDPPDPPVTPIYFSEIYNGIIAISCKTCHVDAELGGVSLASYDSTLTKVIPGDPENSILFQQVDSGAMPQGGVKVDQVLIDKLYLWIKQGAKDDLV